MSDSCIKHIEDYWKSKTGVSNELFNQGSFNEALLGYKEALYRAETLNNHFFDCIRVGIPFMQVYIISCNNIAYTYEVLGSKKEAKYMLRRVLYYLVDLLKHKKVKVTLVQTELKRAYLAYLQFAEKNEDPENKHKEEFQLLSQELNDVLAQVP
ncbi:hypothetical protein [Microscilla marina]|uniref:Tetratricopeptide repeat domain protein n=1 Tax=Microscilla marina ATCC 23134 TaxID=313606 RepID=A1ZNL0_MICM2|nr:hypothetical protein [Microscilla marina]EAY28121.1 hypothetical protein M23134_02231 [Microscilla marina ATCC 23134]